MTYAGNKYKFMNITEQIKADAEHFFKEAKTSHNWRHTLRVVAMCKKIAKTEPDADIEILICAAYLHDIGRKYQDETKGAICHAAKSATLAEPFINKLSIDENRKNNIIRCIKSHRFRGKNIPNTLEAKILFDADKLDSIGAIGVARAFLFAGEIGASLHNDVTDIDKTVSYSKEDTGYREFNIKLSKIKDKMFTKEGRRIAEERDSFMRLFFERFLLEHEGKK